MPREDVRIGYMDSVDFDHELSHALGGNTVFPSAEDARANKPCIGQCGIYEVEIRFRRVIQAEDWSREADWEDTGALKISKHMRNR